MMNEIINDLLINAVKILLLIGIGYVIHYIRTKVGAENLNRYISLARVFVTSVEQELGGGLGADKKAEVLQLLKNATKGKLPEELMNQLIEAAVFEMNQQYNESMKKSVPK